MHIEALTLSICGGIQPGKLAPYVQGAIDGGDDADGLLQRIQLLVWPDSLGAWVRSDRHPDIGAKNRAFEIFAWLDELQPNKIGAESTQGGIPFLRFAPDAQRLMDQWRDELEARLRSNELESTPAFEAHLCKYRSLMPSLALLFHLVALADGGTPGGVTFEAAKLAAVWCDYLEQHAKKVYAAELYPGVEATQLLATKIEAKAISDHAPVRDIYRHHWSGLSTPAQVADGLDILVEVGWVRVEMTDTGGRPVELLRLHPDLSSGEGE